MHPEIKKFWKDSGYIIVVDWALGCGPSGMYCRCHWVLVKNEMEMFQDRGMSELQPMEFNASGRAIEPKDLPPCTAYLFHGETYTEEQMLRIIKLKAFL